MKDLDTLAQLLKVEPVEDVAAFVLFKFKDKSVDLEIKSTDYVGKYTFYSNITLDDAKTMFNEDLSFAYVRSVIQNFLRNCIIRFDDQTSVN